MINDVAPNYGTIRGYSFQAVREIYDKHERVIISQGFYMRETYIHAERAQITVSQVQGIEAKVPPSKTPQALDTAIINRIAPKQKPNVYDQRQAGYLTPNDLN